MKRLLSIFFIFAMIFSLTTCPVAFATEANSGTVTLTSADTEIRPYGSLYGIGSAQISATSASSKSGSFTVDVDGVMWVNAQSLFTVLGFNSKTQVTLSLYNPNGSLSWNTLDYTGRTLTSGSTAYKTIAPSYTGTYNVRYTISTIDGSPIPSGTLLCEIY